MWVPFRSWKLEVRNCPEGFLGFFQLLACSFQLLAASLVMIGLVSGLWPGSACAASPAQREHVMASTVEAVRKSLELHGEVRQETAYRVAGSKEWTKIRQQALLTESVRLTDELSLRATQRAWYDAVFDATDNFPESVESDQEWALELRETYLDYSHGPFDARIGKQQVVWGDAVGLFFADIVNAKDLREYILPDFDLIRIPQWAVDLEYTAGQAHAEFVWLPVLQFHKLGV